MAGAPRAHRYDAPLSVNPRLVHKNRRPVALLAVVAVSVIGLGVLAWVFWPSSGSGDTTAGDETTTTESQTPDDAPERLVGMLPRGYSADACETVVPREGALAQASCQRNDDPGGPLSATYMLADSERTLEELFSGIVATLSVVDCPGNIQSPGPWRRNAAPDRVAGTLVCGFDESTSTVAWTTDSQLLVSKVQSGPQGPNMVQLYDWWSSHS